MHKMFRFENLKGRDHLKERIGVGRKVVLDRQCWQVWTGFVRLSVGSSGGLLLAP